jgi:hypothetical protein
LQKKSGAPGRPGALLFLLVFLRGVGKKRVVAGGFLVVSLWCFGVLTWFLGWWFFGAKKMPLFENFSVEMCWAESSSGMAAGKEVVTELRLVDR